MGIDRIVVFKIALNKDANVDIFLYFCLPAETTNDKRKQQQKNPITIGMGPIIYVTTLAFVIDRLRCGKYETRDFLSLLDI
jgi:hypothetical protein